MAKRRQKGQAENGLAPTLKRLRELAGLTLRDAASLASELSSSPDGAISYSRLAAAESGRSTALSLEKLLCLSAIYGQRPERFIELATPALRQRYTRDFERWRASGRDVPAPILYLPHVRGPIDAELRRLVTDRGRDVRVPLGREVFITATVTRLLTWNALPAWLAQQPRRVVAGLWDVGLEVSPPGRSVLAVTKPGDVDFGESRRIPWHESVEAVVWQRFVENRREFLLYEAGRGPALLELVAEWSIVVAQQPGAYDMAPLACRLADPALDELYGLRGVPGRLVRAVRWRQAAHVLHAARPERLSGLRPPPDPLSGMIEFVRSLAPPPAMPDSLLDAADLVALADALADAAPALRHKPAPAPIRDFLRAAASGSEESHRRPESPSSRTERAGK